MANKKTIQLPQSPEAFEELIRLLQATYGFDDSRVLNAVVARAIVGMDNQTDTCTLEGLAKRMRSAIAKNVANFKFEKGRHEEQVDALKEHLLTNPLDQEALDKLQKAANEGSDYAKKALESATGNSGIQGA